MTPVTDETLTSSACDHLQDLQDNCTTPGNHTRPNSVTIVQSTDILTYVLIPPPPPPFGPRCRLFNIGPKVGPPLGPPFLLVDLRWTPPPFKNPGSAPELPSSLNLTSTCILVTIGLSTCKPLFVWVFLTIATFSSSRI